jgi:chaperone required for assembly of F1-ATPase
MSNPWAIKRFWAAVSVVPAGTGFAITLDNKPVRTPAKAPLVVPTRGLAQFIAAEWEAQTGKVDPGTMPATRISNSAIDKVIPQKDEVADMLAAYGGSDLLCYRADSPAALVARQSAAWDPLLDWTYARYGARLAIGPGVMPVPQDPAALELLAAEVIRQDAFQLAAFHDLVAISGSLILALAVIEGVRSPSEAWDLSRLDETWQEEHWGADDEATDAAAIKRAAFLHAARFHALTTQAPAP